MKIKLTSEKWLQRGCPTIGGRYFLWQKGKKVWFDIVVQGWTKDGVFLNLSRKK